MKDESHLPISEQSLVFRLRKRAEIRRNNTERLSVQEGKPDRIADLLEEAANEIEKLTNKQSMVRFYYYKGVTPDNQKEKVARYVCGRLRDYLELPDIIEIELIQLGPNNYGETLIDFVLLIELGLIQIYLLMILLFH